MNELKYQIQTDEDGKPYFINKSAFLSDLKEMPNTLFIATIKKARRTRTVPQNAFYWGNYIQSQIDCFKEMWGESYTKNQIHDWNKCNLWAEELIVGDEVFKIPQSSKTFTTVEWEERLEIGRTFFLNKFDWMLPFPNQQTEIAIDPDALHNKI